MEEISIFDIITLLGGLAMFLYGMRVMGDALKESSSGPLKNALEKLTNTPGKAFLLGLAITAVIQSSTATIVITSGLVAAGVISLRQSLGVIVGANVGTTVTGQIIRLLDVDSSGTSILRIFTPSTLAPIAMIVGIIFIMCVPQKGPVKTGEIIIGFGILFSGLLSMTGAVEVLNETGVIEGLFSRLGSNPVLAYGIGAAVAFILQSSSASIGILQAFATSGQLTFCAIYAVLAGIYLGDCVTTAIVINIGAKPNAKRVGYINIIFNLCKIALILIAVFVLYHVGALDGIWNSPIDSGGIANTNTVFNLASAAVLFPLLGLFEKLSYKLVKDAPAHADKYSEQMDALDPVFFSTPAIALGRCYDALLTMFDAARTNIDRAFDVVARYDAKAAEQIERDEDTVDLFADRISNYLVQISAHLTAPNHVEIMNHYYSVVTEFERLSDHATNILEITRDLRDRSEDLPGDAQRDLAVLRGLIDTILDDAGQTFRHRDVAAARRIEPLEQVVDDMVSALKDNNMERIRAKACSTYAGSAFMNLLSEAERISDACSNIGVATIARAVPELKHQVHDYVSMLHSGGDENFNREYREAHERYFRQLK